MDEYVADITRSYLLYFIIPFWLTVGFGDYLCHRQTYIERTSGLRESLVHLLMFAEITVPVTVGLHFEITSLVIVIMLIAFVIHEVTALYDIYYAQSRRAIWLIEQHLHSYLAVIPFMVTSFVLCLHWSDFTALFGIGDAPADFGLRWRQQPFSVQYHVTISTMALGLLVLPYLEEAWRCFRYQQRFGVPPQADSVLPPNSGSPSPMTLAP